MKIFTIVGARPNFVKIDPKLPQIVVHTGQHYDSNMSDVFFEETGIPKPKFKLNCQNRVGNMIDKLRKLFQKEKPDLVLVFGDTHSSLAGALAGAYEKIPVAHVEAGLRSFNNMPEEVNRKVIDSVSSVLLCPTEQAVINLMNEGRTEGVYLVGDPMFDALVKELPIPRTKDYQKYILLTIHREINGNKKFLQDLLNILADTEENYKFPAHPRVQDWLKNMEVPKNVKIIDPVAHKEMLTLISNSKKIITDSGGVQKEGAWMNIPVILMRKETEWVELLDKGSIILSDIDSLKDNIETFKGAIISAPNKNVNEKIREVLFKYL